MTAQAAAARNIRAAEPAGTAVAFDLWSAEFQADPFPLLHRLRAEDPVHRSPHGFWFLTRYDDVAAVLRDSRRYTSATAPGRLRAKVGNVAAFEYVSRRMQNLPPPRHERLRSLLSCAFGAPRIKALRQRIQAIVESRLAEAAEDRRMEVMGSLADPLPSFVIGELLGVPQADRERLSAWTEDTAVLFEIASAPARARAYAAAAAAMAYAQDLLRERRRMPAQDDLIGAMMLAGGGVDGLAEEEIAANIVFLSSAGHRTTRDLIGNGLIALLAHPDQWRRLAFNAALLPGAVEECLRYDSSVAMSGRWVLEDTVIGGKQISAGDHILLSLSAANRDPARFRNPDQFDIERIDNRHLAFGGGGLNHCLGLMLARLQAQIVFQTLSERFPGLRMEGDTVQWHKLSVFRSPIAVQVRW